MRRTEWHWLGIPPDTSAYGYLVGTAGFNLSDWVGRFYPPNSTVRERLDSYQTYFSFLEVSCYFCEPQREMFTQLARNLKDNVECSVRIPKPIACPNVWNAATGVKMLDAVFSAINPLIECGRLFSLIFSLDEKTIRSQKRLDYIVGAASVAGRNRIDTHIEFRHKSWHTQSVLQVLKDHNIGICNVEIPANSAFPLKSYATSNKGYLRYCGRMQNVGTEANDCFDYDYTTSDIETMVRAQLDLGRKVDTSAVVYGNVARAQAVANAVQNLLLLNHEVEVEKMRRNATHGRYQGKKLGAKGIKIN